MCNRYPVPRQVAEQAASTPPAGRRHSALMAGGGQEIHACLERAEIHLGFHSYLRSHNLPLIEQMFCILAQESAHGNS